MILSSYRDWIRASQAEAFLFKEKEMNIDPPKERRLQPGQTKYEPFVSDETLKKWKAIADAVPVNGETPTPPIAATAVNQIQAQAQLQAMLTYTPLTAQQRITELNKKISEYKALLEVIQDATIKALLVKMFQNIEKELLEIGVQVAQISTQKPVQVAPTIQPVIQPWNPNQPWGPTLGPIFTAEDAAKTTLDQGYTVCAGKTCITYGADGSVSATTKGGALFNGNSEDGK